MARRLSGASRTGPIMTCIGRTDGVSQRSRKDALHGRGQANFCRGRYQAIRTPGPRDNARLNQRLDDLLNEEGIAARALLDEPRELVERRITAEEVGE
jgi:hypothetical protein